MTSVEKTQQETWVPFNTTRGGWSSLFIVPRPQGRAAPEEPSAGPAGFSFSEKVVLAGPAREAASLSREDRLEGLSHVPFLSSCLPQSDNASEEAGEGEYVSLCSSGQSSEELADPRGVSNLGLPGACGLAPGLGPASVWPSPPVTSRPGPRSLASSALWVRTWLLVKVAPVLLLQFERRPSSLADGSQSPRSSLPMARPCAGGSPGRLSVPSSGVDVRPPFLLLPSMPLRPFANCFPGSRESGRWPPCAHTPVTAALGPASRASAVLLSSQLSGFCCSKTWANSEASEQPVKNEVPPVKAPREVPIGS